MECSGVLPTTQFTYRKGVGACDHFCACPIHCKVHWKVGRRLGSCRLISVQPLIWSTIRALSILSIGSALWALEALCRLYLHSFCQTYHSTIWWMVVGVNCLTYQECNREVFGPVIVPPVHFRAFFHSGK